MKRLLSQLMDCALGPLFNLLEAGAALCAPLVAAAIIDRGIPARSAGYILGMGLALAALGLAGLACSSAAQYFAAKASSRRAARLRRAVFHHMLRLSPSQLDCMGTTALIERLTGDIDQVRSGIKLCLLLPRSPAIALGTMSMAFTIDRRCGWIFVAVISALAAIIFGIQMIALPIQRRAREQQDDVALRIRETSIGAHVLRSLGCEEREIDELSRRHARLIRSQTAVNRIRSLMNPLSYTIVVLALILILHAGGAQVDAGSLTLGQVIALAGYLGLILTESIGLSDLVFALNCCTASARRIRALLELRPELRTSSKSIKPRFGNIGRIDFEHVSAKRRGSSAETLSDISFSIRRGQIIGLIGGIGAGKSALVSLIPRFYDASSGTVKVNGVDVRRRNLRALRKQIGFVSQDAPLFRGSIRDNLRLGDPDAGDDALMLAVRTAQAEDVVRRMGGLDGEIEAFGRNLTDSQRQRLSIARALVRKPEILILDDSTSALHFTAEARLRMAFRQLPYMPTVLIATRRAASVRFADRILVLDDGRLVGDGTHEQLIQSCPIYQKICDSQFPEEVSA